MGKKNFIIVNWSVNTERSPRVRFRVVPSGGITSSLVLPPSRYNVILSIIGEQPLVAGLSYFFITSDRPSVRYTVTTYVENGEIKSYCGKKIPKHSKTVATRLVESSNILR